MASMHVSKVVDTRLGAHSNATIDYVAEQGAMNVVYFPLQSTSSSTQSTNWNLNNIADKTCRDSRLCVSGTVTLTMNFTNTTGNPINAIQADNFGTKSWFFNRAISSITHKINGATENYNNNQIIDAISRVYADTENVDFFDNLQPDLTNTYSAATGSNLNPLASYSSSIQGDGIYKPRTLNYSIVSGNAISANATGAVVVSLNFYEPLVSPFSSIAKKDGEGLYAINGETINVNYITDLFNNMFAYYAPDGLTPGATTVSFGNILTLNCIYLTPYAEMSNQLPHQSVYHYNYYQTFTNAIGAFPSSSSQITVASQTISVTNVPSKILIYARLSDGNRLASIPDTYLNILRAQISFDNGQNVLQGANADQLYDISVRNGLVMPRAVWKQQALNTSISPPALYGCGSILVVDPVLDCSVRPDITTASPGRFVIQVPSLIVQNNTGIDLAGCSLFVVCVNNAVLERNGSEYTSRLLSMPSALFESAKELPAVSQALFADQKHDNMFLGGGKVSDFFKKALKLGKTGVSKALDWAVAHPNEVKQGVDVGRQFLGVGEGVRHVAHKKRMDLFYQ